MFTIAGVYAVNPVSQDKQAFLQQFTVMADADSGASTGPAALTVAPAIITSGPYRTVDVAPADNAAITVMGTGGAIYPQNLCFHKNAFALDYLDELEKEGANANAPTAALNVLNKYTGQAGHAPGVSATAPLIRDAVLRYGPSQDALPQATTALYNPEQPSVAQKDGGSGGLFAPVHDTQGETNVLNTGNPSPIYEGNPPTSSNLPDTSVQIQPNLPIIPEMKPEIFPQNAQPELLMRPRMKPTPPGEPPRRRPPQRPVRNFHPGTTPPDPEDIPIPTDRNLPPFQMVSPEQPVHGHRPAPGLSRSSDEEIADRPLDQETENSSPAVEDTEEKTPAIEWKPVQGFVTTKETFNTNGPVRVELNSMTFGVDGMRYTVDWHPLDKNGNRETVVQSEDYRAPEYGGIVLPGVPSETIIEPPYDHPYGFEVTVRVPPQAKYNDSSTGPYLNIYESK